MKKRAASRNTSRRTKGGGRTRTSAAGKRTAAGRTAGRRATTASKSAVRRRAPNRSARGRATRAATTLAPPASLIPNDPIRHVVVLMLENRSFDQMLGVLQHVHPDLDGVRSSDGARSNRDAEGQVFQQRNGDVRFVDPDPEHDLNNVLHQMRDGMTGFVDDYVHEHPETSSVQRQKIMDYFALDEPAALHALARHFTVCDRWHSSVPGPTWTNRFFLHSGTALGRVKMPGLTSPSRFFGYDQTTVFDRLNQRGIPWRVYYGDIPQSFVLSHQRDAVNADRYARLSQFARDVRGPEGRFPSYVFVEPRYMGKKQNDDHPPSDAWMAQSLVADLYNGLRANDALWSSTLFVVTYDEHGGFYDHVSPPAATPPDAHAKEWSFDRYGVRVPAVLCSPYVRAGVDHTLFDHTSVLKYLTEKWGLGPLGARTANAQSIGRVIGPVARADTPARISAPAPVPLAAALSKVGRSVATQSLNANQASLVAFSEQLEQEAGEPASLRVSRAARRTRGVLQAGEVAQERFEAFLARRRRGR